MTSSVVGSYTSLSGCWSVIENESIANAVVNDSVETPCLNTADENTSDTFASSGTVKGTEPTVPSSAEVTVTGSPNFSPFLNHCTWYSRFGNKPPVLDSAVSPGLANSSVEL